MQKYVDGHVIPVTQNKLDEYKKIAKLAGSIWKEHDALGYIECMGNDLDQVNQAVMADSRLQELMNPLIRSLSPVNEWHAVTSG